MHRRVGAKIAAYRGRVRRSVRRNFDVVVRAVGVFMHISFSLLGAGRVWFKTTENMFANTFIVVTVGFLYWYNVGYPLALGFIIAGEPDKFAGRNHFAMDCFVRRYDLHDPPPNKHQQHTSAMRCSNNPQHPMAAGLLTKLSWRRDPLSELIAGMLR